MTALNRLRPNTRMYLLVKELVRVPTDITVAPLYPNTGR